MAAPQARGRNVPSWLVGVAYPSFALVLTLVFVYLGFPYDLLVARYIKTIESASSMQVRIGDAGPQVSPFGPGIAVFDVRAVHEGDPPLAFDRLFVRPAWSFSWLSGQPAVHVVLESPIGAAVGTLTVGEPSGFAGRLEAVQIRAFPLERLLANLAVDGTLDAEIDLHGRSDQDGGGLVGTVVFDVENGSIAGAGLPIGLPFETFRGTLRFGEGEEFALVEGVAIEGPMLAATIDGRVGPASVPGHQPLDLAARYEIRDGAIAALLGGAQGESEIHITGTLAQPVVR